MKRRRLLTVLAPLGLAAVVFFAVGGSGAFGARSAGPGDEGDGHGCSLATLKGAYAYEVKGEIFAASGAEAVELAGVGLFVADGKGHSTGHDWASLNGAGTPRTLTATYTIEPDCTGTAHVVYTPGGPANAFLVVTQNGRVVKLIQTDPGVVASGEAVRG
jgi:hypothetical protein